MRSRRQRLGSAAVAALGAALCAVAAAVTVAGSESEYAWLEGVARSLMVGTPIAVGLYARRRPPFERFGTLLIAGGMLWFLTTLAGSQSEAALMRELLVAAIFAAVTVRLAYRVHGAGRLIRRTLAPVLAMASASLVLYPAAIVLRRVAPDSRALEICTWLIALAVPAAAAAFLVGLVRWRLFTAAAMQRLVARLSSRKEPDDLRAALAEAFEDPSLEVAYRVGDRHGGWVDAEGHAVLPPAPGSGRGVSEIRDDGRPVAAVIHDAALLGDRAFVDSATAYALVTTADDERKRIEHALHDGAQQRLVALRIRLELAAARVGEHDADEAELLRGLGLDVEEALDEIRSLAHGVYPAPLAHYGLVEALRSAARRTVVPTTVHAAGMRRYPSEIESATYFCCLEALQNAAKHATDATAVAVELSDNGSLRLEVRDDGAGFDVEHMTPGFGLVGMRDRLAAVGGELDISSRPGHGTCVNASIPLGEHPAA
jgi:signal transduction histidine kinase